MHEVRLALLERQAQAVGIPLTVFPFDINWSKEAYGAAMLRQMEEYRRQGATVSLFGDLYLEPLRRSRERNCQRSGMRAVFPLWQLPQREVMQRFVSLGFRAIVTCVDSSALPDAFLGRLIDEDFLRDLPPGVDVCGENGEYHSFVFDGPIFRCPVIYRVTGQYSREYPGMGEEKPCRYGYLAIE